MLNRVSILGTALSPVGRHPLLAALCGLLLGHTVHGQAPSRPRDLPTPYPVWGEVERLDPRLDALLAPDAVMEQVATGFRWSEGPVWVPREKALFFSDVPVNRIYRWSEREGLKVAISPSGATRQIAARAGQGSNGLTLDAQGRLVVCQHGDRRIARHEPDGGWTTLVEFHRHRRLHSPNDLVFSRRGDLYFTDPPYGLPGLNNSPLRELAVNGIYRWRPGQGTDGLELLVSDLNLPNGLAFSPDEGTLYVAQSDPQNAILMAYPVLDDGRLGTGRVLFDFKPYQDRHPGMPDGLKVDAQGHIFTTGPGGVYILSPEGGLLGRLLTHEPTGNCAWGDDGSTFYITANHSLLRIPTRTRGFPFPASGPR